MKAGRKRLLGVLALWCFFMQASGLMVLLHVYTDTKHHDHGCDGDPHSKHDADDSKCPICFQLIVVIGKYMVEPLVTTFEVTRVFFDSVEEHSQIDVSFFWEPFLPRPPPLG